MPRASVSARLPAWVVVNRSPLYFSVVTIRRPARSAPVRVTCVPPRTAWKIEATRSEGRSGRPLWAFFSVRLLARSIFASSSAVGKERPDDSHVAPGPRRSRGPRRGGDRRRTGRGAGRRSCTGTRRAACIWPRSPRGRRRRARVRGRAAPCAGPCDRGASPRRRRRARAFAAFRASRNARRSRSGSRSARTW